MELSFRASEPRIVLPATEEEEKESTFTLLYDMIYSFIVRYLKIILSSILFIFWNFIHFNIYTTSFWLLCNESSNIMRIITITIILLVQFLYDYWAILITAILLFNVFLFAKFFITFDVYCPFLYFILLRVDFHFSSWISSLEKPERSRRGSKNSIIQTAHL